MPIRALASGRFLLYVIGFPAAAILDTATPEGIADWLIEVILVWVASVLGSKKEMFAVAGIGSAIVIGGLWSSPRAEAPFWMDAVNRVIATAVIWTMAHVAARRRAAEEAKKEAIREIKILAGLLPICAKCKAIRSGSGEWNRLESYLLEHSEAKLTHSLCPTCAQILMDEV